MVGKFDIDIVYRGDGGLATDLDSIIEQAKDVAFRAVDVVLVYRNWLIGKRIAEEELKGAVRAEYGKETMRALAEELTAKYGAGFDFGSLYKYLAFFKRFEILGSLSPKSGRLLSWTHYRKLLQIEDNAAMRWYLDEAAAEAWSVRTLQRNISSQYYERTLLSQSKDAVHAEMIKITKPLQQKRGRGQGPLRLEGAAHGPARVPAQLHLRRRAARRRRRALAPEVIIRLSNGHRFRVLARNLSRENKYVKSVTLNGKPLAGFMLKYADIMAGGELVFEMSSRKNP